ncbi:spidroin-2 [Pan troglodytes]|uniref:spidroin-2 n=1 Tax=Pan troglodytes TaxID=9598 RepID=UPI0030135866
MRSGYGVGERVTKGKRVNGFDLFSWLRVSPLGRGKGLQKPQLPLWQRAAPGSAPGRANVGGGERLPSPPLSPLPSRRSRVCGCVSACVSLAHSRTRSGTSAGGEPAALRSLAPAAAFPPRPGAAAAAAAAAAASAVAAGHGPARTGPRRRRRRRPEPRFGSCLSRAARGAAVTAGGGWGCPGGAPSPQGERGAGAQPESPSSPRRAGPCAPRAAAAATAARASMAPSPRSR